MFILVEVLAARPALIRINDLDAGSVSLTPPEGASATHVLTGPVV
jgi:hypothetical protein